MTNTENIIEMNHIVKDFNGFKANNDMNLKLRKGEILALLGENGAGKSTLMSILSGLLEPSSGQIKVRGKEVKINDPSAAKKLGIGMVHQHFMLAHSFTVLENIILGHETTKGLFLDTKAVKSQVTKLAEHYHLSVNLDAKVADINVAQQQKVEILKVLYRGADILIFDEPTSVLTPQEIDNFMKILKNLAHEGKSIILITHKLEEIKAVTDEVTVIRAGKDVGSFEVSKISNEKLAELVVGHYVEMQLTKNPEHLGQKVLSVNDLYVKESRGPLAVKGLSFDIRAGEILGIAGIDGNGQDKLVEAITGLRRVDKGAVLIKGQDMANRSVRKITESGVSSIPADRQKYGLILQLSLADNLVLQSYYHSPFSKHGIINFKKIAEHAKTAIKKFDIRTSSPNLPAGELSGGNQQKVIIARELEQNNDLIIAFQPTRGLDVGAIEYIHKQLLKQRYQVKAILLVSYELSEIRQLSDRILVLHDGQKTGIVSPKDTSETELGLLMTGIKKEGKELDHNFS